MNQRLLLFSFLLFHCFAYSQTSKLAANKPSLVSKPPIDTTAIFNWPHLYNDCSISPDGSYIMYTIFNQPRGKNTLVIQSTNDTAWKKQMVDATAVFFSADEKQAVYSNRDTLFFLSFPMGKLKTIAGVSSSTQPRVEKGTWLAYQLKGDAKELVLFNLIAGEEQNFTSVEDYSFSENGKTLLVKQNDHATTSLQWINLETKKASIIWTAQNNMQVSSYNFDQRGEQLVFMVKAGLDNTVWYYKEGMDTAVEKINEKTEGIASGFQISSDVPFFNKGGMYIFFKLQKPIELPKSDSNAVAVDVWSYKDVILIPEQPKSLTEKYASVINIDENKVVQVEKEGEQIMIFGNNLDQIKCDYLVVTRNTSAEFWWNWHSDRLYYLVSLKDGQRGVLRSHWTNEFIYSPEGKYIIYFDPNQKHFISYEIATQTTRNITKAINERLDDEYKMYVPGRTYPSSVGIAGWLENDDALLIYDNYDIWKVDPLGKALPINITNGYGKRNSIKFRLINEKDEFFNDVKHNENELVLITAFNIKNKFNGFFKKQLSVKGDPIKLTMDDNLYYRDDSQIPNKDDFDDGMRPLKSENHNLWLVKRQCPTQAPNYFLTNDFKNYKPITNFQPQKAYNWLTTELITFKQLDGTTSQGILYKPENFDPHKKYPVLFSYYETMSYRMYEYPTPALARARFDIPWYVSRGYLVFTPDIYYSIASMSGKVAGDHAVNSIVGAVQHLSNLPFVDGKKIGIQGHSFAGGETNYLITHSNIFAAACEASGGCNAISNYLALRMPNGQVLGDKQIGAEIGQSRFGATLWQRPDIFIKATSVLKAHNVTSPLLIMHNQGDGAVNWSSSVEMYLALRRLEKPVWMLQYDNENHQIRKDKNAIDFTIRMNQFFDHYLKNQSAPKWMTIGIPAALKRKEARLDYDQEGICSKSCIICQKLFNSKAHLLIR